MKNMKRKKQVIPFLLVLVMLFAFAVPGNVNARVIYGLAIDSPVEDQTYYTGETVKITVVPAAFETRYNYGRPIDQPNELLIKITLGTKVVLREKYKYTSSQRGQEINTSFIPKTAGKYKIECMCGHVTIDDIDTSDWSYKYVEFSVKKKETNSSSTTTLKKATVKKITGGKKSATVKWKKITGASGYQIQYGLKSNFKGANKKLIKGGKKTTASIKKLKSKKKYYIRIRAYKTIKGGRQYGKWSKIKSVKTK